jgi:hypothetical protein
MNYVLYIIGGGCIILGLLSFGKIAGLDPQAAFAGTIVIFVSGSLTLSGIFICAMGSVIGILKKIARNTDTRG